MNGASATALGSRQQQQQQVRGGGAVQHGHGEADRVSAGADGSLGVLGNG